MTILDIKGTWLGRDPKILPALKATTQSYVEGTPSSHPQGQHLSVPITINRFEVWPHGTPGTHTGKYIHGQSRV